MPSTDILPDPEEISTEVNAFVDLFRGQGAGAILLLMLKALGIFVACIIAKRILLASIGKLLERSHVDQGLQKFLCSFLNAVFWFITIIIVISSLGINPTPLIAAFSIVGLALSLAVQDSLANLAGGINILVSKPFAIGDYVEIGDDGGTVFDIGMVHTKLTTVDNRRIILPNSKVTGARVINYAAEPSRRVELRFSASYDAPIGQVKDILGRVVAEHPKSLEDPAPLIRVSKYGDSTVEYLVRVWCLREDYWDLHFDLLEQGKLAFDEQGIEMIDPHMDVRIRGQTPPAET